MSILNIKKSVGVLLTGALLSTNSFAAISPEVNELLTTKLQSLLKVQVDSIEESPVKGLYEFVSQGDIYYISENGQFLLNGDIYDIDNGMNNLTSAKVDELRKESAADNLVKIKNFEKDMIVYKAENEKHVVTVFTDTSCGYCQKLQSEISEYNKLGITIRYLAFPRGGLNSNAYHTMVSVWCSDDPKQALDDAKKHREIDSATCDNTVKEQYELGVSLGITGTPTLFLEDGTTKPGYLPPERLLQVLEQKK